jgi:hypothetical protein
MRLSERREIGLGHSRSAEAMQRTLAVATEKSVFVGAVDVAADDGYASGR